MSENARTPEAVNGLTTEQLRERLRKIKCFMLDMDGTFYLGNQILEGSLDFLDAVEATGRRVLFLTNNMFPTVLLLIPLYTIMRQINLLYTPWALVLSYTTFTIPFSVWLLNGYLQDLPLSMEEAAMIDGANRPTAFIRIVLPILLPCLLATGVYIFMQSWNEYTFAVLFTNKNNRTIPVALKMLIGQMGVQWDLITAGGIITVIPVCIMFFFAQKRLVAGLTAGAVKG